MQVCEIAKNMNTETGALWRTLMMLRIGSKNFSKAPSLLMARARTAAQQKHLGGK